MISIIEDKSPDGKYCLYGQDCAGVGRLKNMDNVDWYETTNTSLALCPAADNDRGQNSK